MKNEKTDLEWIKQLPEVVQKQYINNVGVKNIGGIYLRLPDIFSSFNWGDSPEDSEYWFDIWRKALFGHFDTPNLHGWIPVSERLPEEGETYCLAIVNGVICIEYFIFSQNKFNIEIINGIDKVTHWQPLPKLPEVRND